MSKEQENQMSFLGHLEELRWRLVKAVSAVIFGGIFAFIFKSFVFDTLLLSMKSSSFPTYQFFCTLGKTFGLNEALCMGDVALDLQNINMAGQFSLHITVSVVVGIIAAFPFVFYQVWRFISPGLTEKERRNARGVVFFVSVLFFGGVLFGYYLIAPLSVQFLGNYTVSDLVVNQIQLSSFINTIATITLSTGIVFQLPIVIYFLSKLGLVTPQLLRKFRKHALVAVLILSAIITPPDVTSQVLVSLPLLVLYEISILISARIWKKQQAELRN
ncbi:MAG: twin-arginine translocase subunit TatC [Luteibaculaceae bacterium]